MSAWAAFSDDQMCPRTGHAAHYLAVLKHITLSPIRLYPIKLEVSIKAQVHRRSLGPLPRSTTWLGMAFMRLLNPIISTLWLLEWLSYSGLQEY